MCAIMGFSTKKLDKHEIWEYFDRTLSRGPDMSKIMDTGSGWLCFHRLAIMGLTEAGMQPFELDGDMVVCNGELYGFRPLKPDANCCRFIGAELPATGGEEPQDCESGRSRFRTKTRCCYVYRTFYCRVGE